MKKRKAQYQPSATTVVGVSAELFQWTDRVGTMPWRELIRLHGHVAEMDPFDSLEILATNPSTGTCITFIDTYSEQDGTAVFVAEGQQEFDVNSIKIRLTR
jgi:hypothetical protein